MSLEPNFAWNVQFRLLQWILILSGAMLTLAFLAVLLPVSWMRATHQWLGLGEFPVAPITEYLARSTSLLYGVHGTIMLFTGLTVPFHWRFIPLIGWLHMAIGIAILIIDVVAGMPTYWIVLEGGPVAALGVLILLLYRQARTSWPMPAP